MASKSFYRYVLKYWQNVARYLIMENKEMADDRRIVSVFTEDDTSGVAEIVANQQGGTQKIFNQWCSGTELIVKEGGRQVFRC